MPLWTVEARDRQCSIGWHYLHEMKKRKIVYKEKSRMLTNNSFPKNDILYYTVLSSISKTREVKENF